MSAVAAMLENEPLKELTRRPVTGDSPEVLTEIYQEETNIAIWQRTFSSELTVAVDEFIRSTTRKKTVLAVTPENTRDELCKAFGATEAVEALSEDVALLVEMFCALFGLKRAGLRLTELDRAMCPRFHVDRIPCRLITTYSGVGTQWLEHHEVDRTKLGTGNAGMSDETSGLFSDESKVMQLNHGDVALMKGELWDDHEGAGLVHRSPTLINGERRLIVTLDFIAE
ncbi:DUF1826 domain-containing protein [Psychrobium sp. 1_MG-2023]|uniref:DUF1826 domain-containing protein n=1 Tax=Psychrobium sp. 1_MG-2023 TaxID=3062624 RepID=UPI000C344021|nr:DUF1826 domain-containing protein [Psychrobium sp. 1_MG-2023]MDP2561360.1 DUF1826 domain-containing protein [Psychrobium sp. 1_MG-2023]PKF54841.1 DUF1826 domain-containing protein [Alteromonadales bacterium alter-6D02]